MIAYQRGDQPGDTAPREPRVRRRNTDQLVQFQDRLAVQRQEQVFSAQKRDMLHVRLSPGFDENRNHKEDFVLEGIEAGMASCFETEPPGEINDLQPAQPLLDLCGLGCPQVEPYFRAFTPARFEHLFGSEPFEPQRVGDFETIHNHGARGSQRRVGRTPPGAVSGGVPVTQRTPTRPTRADLQTPTTSPP